jgi:SAM-dependent methyltransferase
MSNTATKRTFLGMPGYGKQTAAAGRGLWRARRDMTSVAVEYRQGSLLAANFNALWCGALNLAHRGDDVSYFAMLHYDIGPQDFWLDAMIEELEAKNLDVLGVAVPIKDSHGLTSLAIDGDSTWRPKCRLTMSEVLQLPETFTSADIGGPLLLNTGCWVCRFNPEWARKISFTVNDRIVFNRATDRYEAEVEPEDWYFSRLLHEMGLKVGATRKIRIDHRGEIDFSNDRAWGKPFDSAYVPASQLPVQFPAEVPGWLQPEEGAALAELSRGKRVLEIGSFCGRSTLCIARTAASVAAVDFFDGRATPQPGDTSSAFGANLKRYGVDGKVRAFHPSDPLPGQFGFVFIDGDHSREAVEADIEKALAVLEPGGLIAFHDYRLAPGQHDGGWDPGVTEAVDALVARGGEIIATHKTLAVVRPPVLVLA